MHRFTRLIIAAPLVALGLSRGQADEFTWNGSDGTWPSLNWTNATTSDSPVAGPTTGGNTATISAGTVTFAGNDTFGNDGTTASPAITLNAGATLNSGGFFNQIWDLNLAGGTLLSDGGPNVNFPAFQLAGTMSVTGSQPSSIGVAATPRNGNNAINVGGDGNATLTLDVSDVTGDAATDLTIAAVLKNRGNGAAGNLTKTGAGTAVLSAANTYTGQTLANGGILSVASGGSVIGTSRVNALGGGQLVIAGTVTVGDNGSFGIATG
jgi:autotransporter-associated beta strand protein